LENIPYFDITGNGTIEFVVGESGEYL